jgi:hypothetical protein
LVDIGRVNGGGEGAEEEGAVGEGGGDRVAVEAGADVSTVLMHIMV